MNQRTHSVATGVGRGVGPGRVATTRLAAFGALVGIVALLCQASRAAGGAAPRQPSRSSQPSPSTAPESVRPNILWISTEDMSLHLGAYGDPLARTPTLDRLATQSIRYRYAFSTAPVCAPSRAAIITGVYQNAIGAQHMRTTEDRVPDLPGPYLAVPPFYVKAFPEYLRAAGYYTTNRVKTDYQFGTPFTIWDEVTQTAHWRNRQDKSQPFFSVVNLMVTHESQIFPSSPARKGKQGERHVALEGVAPVAEVAEVAVAARALQLHAEFQLVRADVPGEIVDELELLLRDHAEVHRAAERGGGIDPLEPGAGRMSRGVVAAALGILRVERDPRLVQQTARGCPGPGAKHVGGRELLEPPMLRVEAPPIPSSVVSARWVL